MSHTFQNKLNRNSCRLSGRQEYYSLLFIIYFIADKFMGKYKFRHFKQM